MAYFEQSFETRSSGFLSKNRALTLILWTLVSVYILQCIVALWLQNPFFEQYLALSWPSLKSGHVWTSISYGFLHETSNILHLILNCLVIFFTGRILESEIGTKQFIFLYFLCLFLGGLTWLANHLGDTPQILEGASAAAMGLLMFFCLLKPDEPMTFLLFFVIPITVKPKWMAVGLVIFEAFGYLFYELPGKIGAEVAYSAHLGGMLAAYLYFRLFYQPYVPVMTFGRESGFFKKMTEKVFRGSKNKRVAITSYTVNITNRAELKHEVDRILDKINNQGFDSLSKEEKKILDQAKDLLH